MKFLTMEGYQQLAERTSKYKGLEYDSQADADNNEGARERLLVQTLALCGEAGELANVLKKHCYGHPYDQEGVTDELGDLLWYVAEVASANGYSLEEVARRNLEKLKNRHGDKFNLQGSLNRKEQTNG